MLFYVEILSIMPDYAPMLLGPIMLKIMLAESAKAYSPTIRPHFLSSSSRFKRGVGVYPGTSANTV